MLYQTTRLHLKCQKSHKGLLANFKWFIVASAGGSGGVLSYLHNLDDAIQWVLLQSLNRIG